MSKITVGKAFGIVCDELKKDQEYRQVLEANIAMAFKDQFHFSGHKHNRKVVHEVANKAAAAFIDMLTGKSMGKIVDGMAAVTKLHREAKPQISNDRPLMQMNSCPDVCPECGAAEVPSNSPMTTYACGSRDYDGRPGTFSKGERCELKLNVRPMTLAERSKLNPNKMDDGELALLAFVEHHIAPVRRPRDSKSTILFSKDPILRGFWWCKSEQGEEFWNTPNISVSRRSRIAEFL